MIPYLVLIITLLINSFLRGRLNLLVILIYWALSAFRYKTGLDYENYDYYFENLPSNEWNYEFGFHFLSLITHYLNINQYFLFSTIYFALLYKFQKDLRNNFLFSLFLITFFFYGFWNLMSVLRQSIALIILFLSFIYSETKKRNIIIFYFLAFSMHYSALFFIIVLEFCKKIEFTRKTTLILILISYILLVYQIDISNLIPYKYQYALEITSLVKPVGISLRFIEYTLITIIASYFNKSYIINKLNSLSNLQIFFYAIFSSISYVSERFNVYFEIFYALLFASILYELAKKFSPYYLSFSILPIMLIFFITFRYYRYLYKADYSKIPEWENTNLERVIPYQSIFETNPERSDTKTPSKF